MLLKQANKSKILDHKVILEFLWHLISSMHKANKQDNIVVCLILKRATIGHRHPIFEKTTFFCEKVESYQYVT
jgi:hypothetical protein